MSVVHTIITTSSPTVAPDRAGQHWVNQTLGKTWLSVGTTSVADWVEVLASGFVKFTLSHAAFQTAALTNNVALLTLPIKGLVEGMLIKTTTAFAGTGITDYKLTVGITGTESKYLPAYDADSAVTGTNYDLTNTLTGGADLNATESIKVFATAVGANLSLSTAGSVDIYVKILTLP